MDLSTIAKAGITSLKDRAKRTIINPTNELVDQNVTELVTTVGSFIIRKVRGKFQRSISIPTGFSYGDSWMEDALYAIIYRYNDVKKTSSKLEMIPSIDYNSDAYYHFDDGVHPLKYRNFNIILAVQTKQDATPTGRYMRPKRIYTVITYDKDTNNSFMTLFEKDMVSHRNNLLRIKADSPTYTIYRDSHEGDGWTYWDKVCSLPKRRLNTIYLPAEQKRTIVDTINGFIGSKKYYNEHGVPYNLKILLYGAPGLGKDSIAKMIASEWCRNLYYVTGGKDGRFIPNALTDRSDDLSSPLFLISDIDKYPFLINEPEFDMSDSDAKDEKMKYKQCFGNMINALDGVLSGEGNIIVMTTNHIEKFSEAFTRPGRIDLKLELGYVTPEVFRQYVYDFYKVVLPVDVKLKSNKLRIAEFHAATVFRKMGADEFISTYAKQ